MMTVLGGSHLFVLTDLRRPLLRTQTSSRPERFQATAVRLGGPSTGISAFWLTVARFPLHSRVSDLPILGQATIEEAKSLLSYFQQQHGYEHVVVAGSSMGGLHAAMIASVYPGDVGATAWLAPPSAIPVFTEGLLAGSCNWASLYKQHELQLLDNMLQGHAVSTASPVEASFQDEDPVQQVKKRMRKFLSITDIDNFQPPRRSDAVVFVVGTEDQYIGMTNAEWTRLAAKWRPAEFRYVKTGHVSGILFESKAFEETIMDVVHKLHGSGCQ
jgi:pimeloyl-ACP methyl ester carboxylesterase